jgi:histidine triad (HIT) family protein
VAREQRTDDGETTVQDCIFCKIARGEIPSNKVYEDDDVIAFHDIRPQAPVHFMLVPKRHIASLVDAGADDAPVLGKMLALAGRLAREQGSPDGFRTIINTGRIGRQDVMHVHIHVIGGPEPLGPMLPRAAH